MPTEKKMRIVESLEKEIASCTIAVATDFRGLAGGSITEMRRFLRERGLKYRVVKNTLALRAAKAAGRESFGQLTEGPTGIIFGYADPVAVAKTLEEFIRTTRSALVVRKGVMDGRLLQPADINALASLPPKEELIAKLLGQLQGPVYGLVSVLSAPMRGLSMVLQRRVEQTEKA